MSNNRPECLFVYGTLMPGQTNHHYLQSIAGEWQQASVHGHLYPDGIGDAGGYPALVLADNAASVNGWLLTADELAAHWPVLDEFEGFAYRRVRAAVVTDSGERLQAYVYVLAEAGCNGQ